MWNCCGSLSLCFRGPETSTSGLSVDSNAPRRRLRTLPILLGDTTLVDEDGQFPDGDTPSVVRTKASGRFSRKFKNREELGEGAFGKVSLCTPTPRSDSVVRQSSKPHVAVKHLRRDRQWHGLAWDVEQQEYIKNELNTLTRVNHPFIIKMHQWFEDVRKGVVHFVMEHCDSGSLQDLLDEVCTISCGEARAAEHGARLRQHFREVADALQHLHDLGIVHCDLKPDNILLKSQGQGNIAKLIDFGLARLAGSTEEGEKWTKGTMQFMAPEQFLKASGTFTPGLDIWALGVIFFWMVTGLQSGSLQHPMVEAEWGVGFEPDFLTLHSAYRQLPTDNGAHPAWRRELIAIEGQQNAVDLADLMLVIAAEERCSARDAQEHAWAAEES